MDEDCAVSTTLPFSITTTRSQYAAARPRSWVIRIVDMPRSRVSSTTRSITAFCVVTSRPVVGSSAIRSCGRQASDADLLDQRDRLFGHLHRLALDVLQQRVLDLAADLADRIERRARILED